MGIPSEQGRQYLKQGGYDERTEAERKEEGREGREEEV